MATNPSSSDGGSFPGGQGSRSGANDEPLLFGRYRVERELGRGGMGRVLLAYDTKLYIHVAIKMVPDEMVEDTEAVNDLRREVLRGMALLHANIVRTHTLELDEHGAGIIMEYIDGWNLTEVREQQPGRCCDPEQILPWLEPLCSVLDYAHLEARIVHRDLKPRNLMLTRAGLLKVADFGIAAQLTDTLTRHTGFSGVSGTPPFMSPQQAIGRKPSPADDLYSLGATIYDLLTGKPPFFRGPAQGILQQVLEHVPPRMSERREELEVRGKSAIPLSWEDTVAACLAKEPANRPKSASDILCRLRAPTAVAAQPAERARRAIQRVEGMGPPASKARRLAWGWVGAALGVAGAAGMGLFVSRAPKSLGPSPAPDIVLAIEPPAAMPTSPTPPPFDGAATTPALPATTTLPASTATVLAVVPARELAATPTPAFPAGAMTALTTPAPPPSTPAATPPATPAATPPATPAATPPATPAATPPPTTPAPASVAAMPPATPVMLASKASPSMTTTIRSRLPMANTDALRLVLDARPLNDSKGFATGESAEMALGAVEGEYRMLSKKSGVVMAKAPALQKLELRDFVCEVEARVAEAKGDGCWGVGLIRLVKPTHPWTGIMINGLGQVNTHSYDTGAYLPWISTPVLGGASVYQKLRFETRGRQFRLFLNDQFVAERSHERLLPCSLVIYTHGSQPGLDVRVRSIRVWLPP